jgi:hypothetical protein
MMVTPGAAVQPDPPRPLVDAVADMAEARSPALPHLDIGAGRERVARRLGLGLVARLIGLGLGCRRRFRRVCGLLWLCHWLRLWLTGIR